MYRHAGELRWRVLLLEPRTASTRSNWDPTEWREWANTPAKIEEVSGSEPDGHDQRDPGLMVLISIPYELPRLPTTRDAVVLQDGTGRVCNIVSVRDPTTQRRQLELSCQTGG